MRACLVVMVTAAASLVANAPSRADHAPSFIVPGRPDVPVVINGRDASYAVVEGDWGLSRPGHIPLEVYGAGSHYVPYRGSGYYFPATGRRPFYGRREVIPPPNAPLPPPAESFHRHWGAASDPVPATTYAPFEPPAVFVEPRRHRYRNPHPPLAKSN